MKCTHFLDASCEATDSRKALPEGFDAGLAIAFAGEEAAQHGDAANSGISVTSCILLLRPLLELGSNDLLATIRKAHVEKYLLSRVCIVRF